MNSVAIARKPSPARECRIALLCHDDAPRPNDKGLVIALKMTDLVEGRRCRFEARLRSRIVIALDWLEGVLKRIAYCFGLVLGLCIILGGAYWVTTVAAPFVWVLVKDLL